MTVSPAALVVEDDAASRTALIDLVSQEGFRVVGAGSLAEARSAMEDDEPDVVLTDLVLPEGVRGESPIPDSAAELETGLPSRREVIMVGNARDYTTVGRGRQ